MAKYSFIAEMFACELATFKLGRAVVLVNSYFSASRLCLAYCLPQRYWFLLLDFI